MKKLLFWVIMITLCLGMWVFVVRLFAADYTIKDVPSIITEQELKEWVGALVERKHLMAIQSIPELQTAQKKAQDDIDFYRIANGLSAMYAVEKPAEPKE